MFVKFTDGERERLRAQGFEFHDRGPPGARQSRLVVSWDQPQAQVDALCGTLATWS